MARSSQRTISRQRYSGTELAQVLRRVHAEHGAQASIIEVNRVRTGGVAGFFSREEFEVIVEPPGSRDDGSDGPVVPARRIDDPAPREDTVDVWLDDDSYQPHGDDDAHTDHAHTDHAHTGADRDREVGTIAAGDDLRLLLRQAIDEAVEAPPVEALPAEPEDGPGAGSSFDVLLRRALEEREEAEELANARARAVAAAARTGAGGAPAVTEDPLPASGWPSVVPVSDVALVAATAPSSGWSGVEVATVDLDGTAREPDQSRRRGDDTFWGRIERAGSEVAGALAADPTTVGMIGPLRVLLPLIDPLERNETGRGRRSVVVLTNRAEIISRPGWRLHRDGIHLINAVSSSLTPTLVVIDVDGDPPIWVGSLLGRLRRAGMDLLRIAVPGPVDRASIETLLASADGPVVLDLLSAPPPWVVLDLIERGMPIGSVNGVEVTAELLVALRREAGRG